MADFSEVIHLFRQGKFDYDCMEIVLEQKRVGGARLIGQGYIRQSEEGILVFKIYVTKRENITPFDRLREQAALIGKLHPDEVFYDLLAMTRRGLTWTAQHILPNLNWNLVDESVVATGQISILTSHVSEIDSLPFHKIHFFEEYDVPLDLWTETEQHGEKYMVVDRAKFESLGAHFEIRKQSIGTVIEVHSDKWFPIGFHLRVQEALQFITAKPAIWRARLENDKNGYFVELASPLRKSARTQFSPPIAPISEAFRQSGWGLFVCFLAYVVSETNDTHWNPVAYHLHNACEATTNSIDAWAVGYSVAVEALSGLIRLENDKKKAEHVAELQKRLRDFLATQEDFTDLVPRMDGLIGILGTERVQDKLYVLADTGHVDPSYIKAWTYLRNRHLHPKLKDLKKPDSISNQKLLDHIHQVEVLLRQITFYLIGYAGPFTDYGVTPFPIKQYPLQVIAT